MHKLMYLLWTTAERPVGDIQAAISEVASSLRESGATDIRWCLVDSDVAAASKHVINHLQPAPFAVLGFKYPDIQPPASIRKILDRVSTRHAGYLVTEREPLPNTKHRSASGQRTPGMNQVVLLRKPDSLNREEWLKRWLDEHTPVAIRTQATFGYRQNIVIEKLDAEAPAIDAIVEENFPEAAMTSAHAFYNAGADDQLLRKNQKEMFGSVLRFVDMEKLDCLPMSEYNF